MKRIIGFVILLIISEVLKADTFEYIFRHWDVVDGMADNQIRYFSLTNDNRIAIRTISTLEIYDGQNFQHFYSDREKVYSWEYNKSQIYRDYHDAEQRIWMKSPGYLQIFDLKTNRFIYDIDNEIQKLGINSRLKDLFIDNDKNYWLVTTNNTLYCYDISNGQLSVIEDGNGEIINTYGHPCELLQHQDSYYIVYSKGLIRRYNKRLKTFTGQDTFFVGKITEKTDRLKILATNDNQIWLMHNQGVYYRKNTSSQWTEVLSIDGLSNFFTCMDIDTKGNVWIGSSWSGLRIIDHETHQVKHIAEPQLGNGNVLKNDIQCLLADKTGGVWIGTLWQGMCYYHPSMYKFNLIQTINNETRITNESIRSLLEDKDGTILIGTTYHGLKRYNPETGKISDAFNHLLKDDLCLTIYRDQKDRLWVGTYLNGFYCIDGNHVRNYNRTQNNQGDNDTHNISRAIYEDGRGHFWVSVSNKGIGELDLTTGQISMLSERHPNITFHQRDYGFYTINDSVFAVYGDNGIYYYNVYTDKVFIPELDQPDNPKFLGPQVSYYSIYRDSRQLEWFGTNIGLYIWDEKQKRQYALTMDNGLANNNISSIQEDEDGVCWVATANGISRITPQLSQQGYVFQIVNFNSEDGLQKGKFYENASIKASDGKLYFGGHHGINSFHPQKMQYNPVSMKPIFASLRLFNTPIKEGETYNDHIIMDKPINSMDEIKLRHNENFFTIEFAGLNYVNVSRTFYRYTLENFDPGWTEILTNGNGSATYTNLSPGEYKLVVYSANNDHIWGKEPATITIIIQPPFWATTPAYISYFIISLFIIYLLFRQYRKRQEKKRLEQEAIKREQQKEELNQMKFRFFTNISHEFRTPLSLIITPLGILINQSEGTLKEKLKGIYNHANNLLMLINQLLDFRKLEMGGEHLQLSQSNIGEFISYTASSFKELANSRSINFIVMNECRELITYFDHTKMQRILNNLYSNAFKFTPDGGTISTYIHLEDVEGRKHVRIEISDTGCGIPEKDLGTIFERFYQSGISSESTGSGIGLHMVKEYVTLHGGKINVQSKEKVGSTFTILIPLDLEKDENATILSEGTSHSETTIREKNLPKGMKTLLIVEDNTEFRHFLTEWLSTDFQIIEACDGVEGEEKAIHHSPDLIISDMMMPRRDGLKMCKLIKGNIQTSHIPIILLTARTSDEARIESYEAGADSYISKPFNFEILQTRIKMLLEQQEHRKERFHKEINISPQEITITSIDEDFMKKALTLVEENMENPEFSVNQLCSDLAMSRSQLYRKFESITGLTPNDFIRSVRLKRAAQLLCESNCHISEISDLVGFNSIKYFNKYFKEEFNVTPTQYRSQHLNNIKQP